MLLLLLMLPLLAACGRSALAAGGRWAGCTPLGAVRGVVVTRAATRLGPPGGIPELRAQGDQVRARRLYRAACRLVAANDHPAPGTAISCPADFGMVYTARFRGPAGAVATARYVATGCRSLAVRTADGWELTTMILGTRAPLLEPAFRTALAAAAGISADHLGWAP